MVRRRCYFVSTAMLYNHLESVSDNHWQAVMVCYCIRPQLLSHRCLIVKRICVAKPQDDFDDEKRDVTRFLRKRYFPPIFRAREITFSWLHTRRYLIQNDAGAIHRWHIPIVRIEENSAFVSRPKVSRVCQWIRCRGKIEPFFESNCVLSELHHYRRKFVNSYIFLYIPEDSDLHNQNLYENVFTSRGYWLYFIWSKIHNDHMRLTRLGLVFSAVVEQTHLIFSFRPR